MLSKGVAIINKYTHVICNPSGYAILSISGLELQVKTLRKIFNRGV